MQKSMFRNGLVAGIIVLLVGVGVLSSVSSKNISVSNNVMLNYDSELEDFNSVEIPFQIYGVDGNESYTITVTINQKEELDAFVDTFKQELDNAETHEETITIFNNAIVTLDEIGLIPKDVSVIELQNTITGNVGLSYRNHINKNINKNSYGERYKNRKCLIAGNSDGTDNLGLHIGYGGWDYIKNHEYSANGWIYTIGFNGKWSYEGKFLGILDVMHFPGVVDHYLGAMAFIGIFIRYFYIGFANEVGIDSTPP